MSQYQYRPGQSPMEPSPREAPFYERPAWDSRLQGYQTQPIQQYQPQPRPESRHEAPPSHFWDEEGSDSDVSRTVDLREPVNRILSPVAAPRQLPQVSSPRILNSLDEVQARLNELERTDDHNAQKVKRLEEKRKRKDERIAKRRALEDEKIQEVRAARARKDERIRLRRQREDDAFRGADKQLGVEEVDLRRRLRSLKRGLPIEDARSTSAASMSPPMPQYQAGSGPPPPKRHQSGPPGQNDSPAPSQARTTQPPPIPSQYHYYQPSNNSQFQVPYHHVPQVSHPSYQAQPPTLQSSTSSGSAGSPRPGNTPVDAGKINGFNPPSAAPVPPPTGTIDTRPPPPSNPPAYDTRPPPPTTGFTSVNAIQASGFATVNARVPSHATMTPSKPVKEHGTPKSEGPRRASGKSPKSTTPITVGGLPLNKRTPSTTHPYQMSEAFANRHHHCEREDELKRGIWTSYGTMGSRDVPTGPPVEMYLRCNHDDCKRIDWRTVHGLQCHIVKNHEQPKGTIGSLEKALAIYGVPVSEIQAYEKIHGVGSAGQMADPKNQKIKNKTKEAMLKSESPGSGDASTPSLTPSASYTSNGTPLGGPLFTPTPSKAADATNGRPATDHDSAMQAKPNNSFVAVRNAWSAYEPLPTPTAKDRGNLDKPPTPTSVPSPATTTQASVAPIEAPEKLLPTANAISAMDSAAAAAVETSRAPPKLDSDPPPPAQTPPSLAPAIESTATESTKTTPVSSTQPVHAPDSNEAPGTDVEAPTSKPSLQEPESQSQPASENITTPPKVEVEPTLPEPEPFTQPEPAHQQPMQPTMELAPAPAPAPEPATEPAPPPQPPSTPARRPSRRESISHAQSKSVELAAAATAMPSPKPSKADAGVGAKRAGRRPSTAVSTASVSAGVSVDGGSGDEGEQKAETGAGAKGGTRRNTTGRFLRKGR